MIRQRNINYVFVLLFTAYTAYTIFFRQSSFFFVVYLFWFDEVIRNTSLFIQLKLQKKQKMPQEATALARSRSTVLSRFFFLFVYSVFIVIVFGIFFHIDKASQDKLFENLRIIMFMDPIFNLCLCIAVVREIILIRTSYLLKIIPDTGNAMDGHMFTMHLSILLGGCMYMLTSGKSPFIHISLGALTPYAMILPFLVIKLIVDLYTIRKENR